MGRVLEEGDNCWRVARAGRAAFIVDGESYFRAVREAVRSARRSIFLVGWDIHSELELIRNGGSDDELPTALGPLLDAVAHERPELDIYILSWDFAMIYAMEREFFPQYKLRWKSHDRVRFCLDGEHPLGASQHQKIVVVDDCLAFCGGLDLSQWRWDTCEHRVEDERRKDPKGKSYPPFHDVQMVVDGEAAVALGELVRERWNLASSIESVDVDLERELAHDPWPASITPELEQVDVGIARTLPDYENRDEVREVERLYLDSIAAARRFIYFENQYLSSKRVGDALVARLEEPEGPELIAIMPEKTGGWLEQHTMDVLRARLLRRLREADRHDRLRVYFVRLSSEPHVALMVHAKIMVVDDEIVRVGSSNLSNRSMGFDSECDLAIESAESNDCRAAITDFRRRLLAEHLGVSVEALGSAEEEGPSLVQAIESLRGGARTLEPLSGEVSDEVDKLVPDSKVLDPEKPVEPEDLLASFVGSEDQKPAWGGLAKFGLLALGVFALAALWRWTPLGDWLDVENLAAIGEWIDQRPFTPLLLLAAYVVAGLAVIPITLLFVATVMVFGPWVGMGYALAGGELAALAAFGVGHMLGRDTVSRFAGSRVNRISRKLSDRGILTTITLRIVPVAPFTVVNVIAGVSDIRLRDFALGSLLGMIPGVLAVAFLTDRIVASLRDPSSESIATLILVVVLIAGGLFGLRRWLARDAEKQI